MKAEGGMMMPKTLAARLEMAARLFGGQPILDDDGVPTGEVTPQLIDRETALRIISGELP